MKIKILKPHQRQNLTFQEKQWFQEMNKILEKLYNDKVILDHGLIVAQELAHVLSGGDTTIDKTLSEDDFINWN